jgi:glycosyltransferase involved in cell wall biosynthesis
VVNYAIPSAYDQDFKTLHLQDFTVSGSGSAVSGKKNNTVILDALSGDDNEKLVFDYNILSQADFDNTACLYGIYEEFKPDCIVGCSFYPSHAAAKLINYIKELKLSRDKEPGAGADTVPFWADLFGHVMAEAQARAITDKSDDCLYHYWNSEYGIISSADIFSVVSERQKYALIGELGAIGRLTMHTGDYEFARCIPCGMPAEPFDHKKNVLSDIKYENDFIILWTGGYNTWTDTDTLFKGLEKAMRVNKNIKFVSTGGEIPEQDMLTYPCFLEMIENSDLKNNFIMMGWIKGEDVPNYYFEADAGINIDKDIYEVRLGSKNRILDWFRAGLPVLSSNVCELTEIIEREGIGYTFKAGDSDDLASKLLYISGKKNELKDTAEKAKKYALENFSFEKTTEVLRQWVMDPEIAPDTGKEKALVFRKDEAVKKLQFIVSNQKDIIEKKDRRIGELELVVSKNLLFRLNGYLKILKRKILRKDA